MDWEKELPWQLIAALAGLTPASSLLIPLVIALRFLVWTGRCF